ncbi:hypothetical protein LSH36_260g05010, partial [Paralvinella palmiformis]
VSYESEARIGSNPALLVAAILDNEAERSCPTRLQVWFADLIPDLSCIGCADWPRQIRTIESGVLTVWLVDFVGLLLTVVRFRFVAI